MDINLTIDNYRCFPSGSPASLRLTKGFSAFVGVNNSGKSSLLKFFYEMRPAFAAMGTDMNVIQQLFSGGKPQLPATPEILDRDEMFFNGNREDIRIEVTLSGAPAQTRDIITKASIQIERAQSVFTAKFFTAEGSEITLGTWQTPRHGQILWTDDILRGSARNSAVVARFQDIRSAFRALTDTYYIPAFRHISPLTPAEGAVQNYYDINVARPFIEMWHGLQTGASKQGQERIYKLIEEIKDNFGFKQLQISAAQNHNSLQLIIDGKPFALQELGAGLAVIPQDVVPSKTGVRLTGGA